MSTMPQLIDRRGEAAAGHSEYYSRAGSSMTGVLGCQPGPGPMENHPLAGERYRPPEAAVDPTPGSTAKVEQTHGGPFSPILDRLRRLEHEKTQIMQLMMLQSQSQLLTYLGEIVAFVHTIELAHQYFDFKDYLRDECGTDKYDYSLYDTYPALLSLPQKLNRFNKLAELDIRSAVNAHSSDMKYKIYNDRGPFLRARESQFRELLHVPPSEQLTAEHYAAMERVLPDQPIIHRSETDDRYAFSNPIFAIVFLSRKGDYVMYEYPEAELQNIKDCFIYEDYLIYDELPMNSLIKDVSDAQSVEEKLKDIISKLTEACDTYNKLRCYSLKLSKGVKAANDAEILSSGAGKATKDMP